MKKLFLAGALGLGLAACNQTADDRAETANNATDAAAADTAAPAEATQTASTSFPKGARIVEEERVYYRVDEDGTRVRLGPNDSRIVVENGVRYRVDPDGSRVRIDPRGATIDIDLPDVDVGINEKGNPDIDVGDRDPDGGR